MKFLCDQCKTKYQIADEKVAGKTVRMKCRKCGHQIEVRAAVTETSVNSRHPADDADPTVARPSTLGPRPGVAPAKPAVPKPSTLATSLAAARPAPARPVAPRAPGVGAPAAVTGAATTPKPAENPSALGGAFQKSVRDDEAPGSMDLMELSAADEWYVAINGVPVGPIRIAEVRRKASTGGVTEDSLVWQEGLEEWRPVRAYSELAAVVREAATSGRSSLMSPTPPPEGVRPSGAPPATMGSSRPGPLRAGGAMSPRPGPVSPISPVVAPRPTAPQHVASAPAARSNVVAIGSRLATAERLDEAPSPLTPPPAPVADAARHAPVVPFVTADPFGSPPAPLAGFAAPSSSILPAPMVATAVPTVAAAFDPAAGADAAPPAKKAPPWIAIAMIVLAAAFGITAAIAVFMRSPPPIAVQPPVVIQMENPKELVAATTTATAPVDSAALPPASGSATPTGARTGGPIAIAGKTAPTTTTGPATTATGGLDLSGLGGARKELGTDTTAPTAPKANGECYSQGTVLGVINAHQTAVRRTCWDRANTQRTSASINVTLTINDNGGVAGAAVGGDDSGVAACVRSEVSRWSFPAGGCTQRVGFSYKFVR